ncbi:alpha/beta hydrolase [Microbacterium esteraromaticum]|uniref:Alpha/beta hydrolase n=1 Tax=Microbacterium esteraromaticum TaxID=57043 RepID=A0A939DT80_9MICO|nr:alpha/beta hydrolase [Microbacterium esteraromaticum]MBN8414721.1 alpha/beta hydrolase [Microbacterium esteraromaticum]
MNALMTVTAASIRTTARVAPALGAHLALNAFFSTTRMRLRDEDWLTDYAARRARVRVGGAEIETYQWGAGPSAVLLMHGWNGRASQFAPLVRDLVGEGYRVVAFDAPAHGDSPGRRTDVRDWVDAAHALSDAEGPFDLIVGHSFGAFAALAAVRDGVPARRVASIAGAGAVPAFHDQFLGALRMPAYARPAFEAGFYRRLGLRREESDARFDTLTHPLPAGTELLLVHDRQDRALDARHSRALHAAHPGRSHLLLTNGLGHNRVLSADMVLDAVLAFAMGGLGGPDGRPVTVSSTPARGV